MYWPLCAGGCMLPASMAHRGHCHWLLHQSEEYHHRRPLSAETSRERGCRFIGRCFVRPCAVDVGTTGTSVLREWHCHSYDRDYHELMLAASLVGNFVVVMRARGGSMGARRSLRWICYVLSKWQGIREQNAAAGIDMMMARSC